MARDQRLNVDITATDKASAKIEDAAKKVDKLDGKTANVKVDADTSPLSGRLDGLEDQLGDLGVPIDGIAGKLGGLASPAGAVAAIGVGMFAVADHAADAALSVNDLANLTGDTVEDASRLQGVWKQSGADAKDLQDVVLQMNGVLAQSPELAAKLGINLNDGKTVGQRFQQVVDVLGDKFTDAGERGQLASQLFGEEGVRQVNTMVGLIDGPLAEAVANFDGQIFTEEDIENAKKLKRELNELKASAAAWGSALGTSVLPVLNEILAFNPKRVGDGIGDFFTPWKRDARETNDAITKIWTEGEAAAKSFDTTLLDGLGTFAEVRAKVIDLTGSEAAANIVAVEWAKSHELAAGETVAHQEAVSKLDTQTRAYTELLDRAGIKAINEATEATNRSRQAHRLNAKALDAETTAAWAAISGAHSYEQAAIATANSIDDVRAAEQAYQDVLDDPDHTKEQAATALRAVRSAQIDSAEAALNQAAAYAHEKGAQDGSTASAHLHIEELRRLQEQFPGLRAELQSYIDKLNNIPTVKATQLVVTSSGGVTTKQTIGAGGKLVAAADGVTNFAGGPLLVGEEGPEIVDLPPGSTVHTNQESRRMLAEATQLGGNASGVAGSQIVLNIHPGAIQLSNISGDVAPEAMMDALVRWIRFNGPGKLRSLLGMT